MKHLNQPSSLEIPLGSPIGNTLEKIKGLVQEVIGSTNVSQEDMISLKEALRLSDAKNASLEAELATIKALYGIVDKDPEIIGLEREVEEMLAQAKTGTFPVEKLYKNRPLGRKEGPFVFLERVYGKYLQPGKEVLFLDQLRKIDRPLERVMSTLCSRKGVVLSSIIPQQTTRLIVRLPASITEDMMKESQRRAVARSRNNKSSP